MASHQVQSPTGAEHSLPPGPRLPSVLLTMLTMAAKDRVIPRWRRRYGDTFSLRMPGGRHVVVISRPEHVRDVFAGPASVYHAGEFRSVLSRIAGEHSMLILDDDDHLRAKRLLMPAFAGRALRGQAAMMTALADGDASTWPIGEPVNVYQRMNALTLEIILRVVFGLADGERLARLRPLIRDVSVISPLAMIGWAYPRLERVWPWRRNRDHLVTADRLIYEEIADRRAVDDLADHTDVLSRLLAGDANGEMSDTELRDHLVTLLIGGHESTAIALAWTFHEIAHHPRVQAAAHQAVDDDDEDYLGAVIKESLRRRPVVPGVARTLAEPAVLAGFTLPAGTVIAPNIDLLHSDPDSFEDPDDFRPERFIGSGPEAGSWIPFGGGIHRCLGASFSLQEATAAVRAVMSRYDLRPARKRAGTIKPKTLNMAAAPGTKIIATPRG